MNQLTHAELQKASIDRLTEGLVERDGFHGTVDYNTSFDVDLYWIRHLWELGVAPSLYMLPFAVNKLGNSPIWIEITRRQWEQILDEAGEMTGNWNPELNHLTIFAVDAPEDSEVITIPTIS